MGRFQRMRRFTAIVARLEAGRSGPAGPDDRSVSCRN